MTAPRGPSSARFAPGKVSVVGAYYNRAQYARASVESLLSQDYGHFEVVLIDDGSTDDTYGVLTSFQDPRLTVVRQTNIGFVRSIRRAIEMTDGEYVSVHGSGDIAAPQLLSRGVAVLASRPAVGVVGPWVVNQDLTKTSDGQLKRIELGIDPSETLLKGFGSKLNHGGLLYRRSLYDSVGGYRPFFTFAQDHDLLLRMSERAVIQVIREPLYRRLMLPGGVSTSPEKRVWQYVLSEFAVFCAKERRSSGIDPLDRYGEVALFLVPRSLRLGNHFSSMAMSALAEGDHQAAKVMARLSGRSAPSLKHRMLRWAVLLASGPSRPARGLNWLLAQRRRHSHRDTRAPGVVKPGLQNDD